MPLVLFLLTCLLCLRIEADDVGLVRVGATWRYLKGTTEPSATLGEWKEPGFADSTWTAAAAGFSSLASSVVETTALPDFGTTYSTVYFRAKFPITDAAGIKWLTLRIDYDDGFVAYLNGTEVARRGVAGEPGSPVPFNATATKHLRGALEEIDLSSFRHLLKAGENLLAIQTLNSGPGDLSMCLSTELLGNFTRGPFVQNASTESIQVIWKTQVPAQGAVEFGPDINNLQTIFAPAPGTNHVVTLTNLAAGTEFLYRVVSSNETAVAYGPLERFKTLKSEGAVTFSVIGDTGWGGVAQHLVANALRAANPELVVQVGDAVYPGMVWWLVDSRALSIYHTQMRTTPFYYAHGNHDSYISRTILQDTFYLPTNNVTGTEEFYSFDHGDVHFVVLQTDLQIGSRYEPGSPQYQWLESDLQQTRKKWKFLFFHHNLRSSAAHAADDYDRNGVLDSEQLKASVGDLAARYGVQAIFNGHDHVYERLAPDRGSAVFVSGGGGAYLYSLTSLHPTSVQFMSLFHFLKVTVDGDTARVQALDWNLKVLDQVHLRLTLPEKVAYRAEWGSPNVESQPANDGDGNIANQRFDFEGEHIPGKTGAFSAPGRLYVKNDKRFLYLGLDEVMLQPDQNLYLFVETPNSSGVNSMSGLGNGVVDPAGEGADGLDFLQNLSFTNFNPNIACILGDEFADYIFRSYVRTGMNQNIGQGAFFLERGLPEVFGARLQQFNRSPQLSAFAGEQNADLIEVALPLSVIGLNAGETIKVAVVVGRGPFDPATKTRQIDNGAIARALHQFRGVTLVEGVELTLGADPDPDNDGLLTPFELGIGTDPLKSDSDTDGMPDGWEYSQGLNPLSSTGRDGAAEDIDGDGYSNYQEYLAGTGPNKKGSGLRLDARLDSGGQVRLEWQTLPGRSYQLQYLEEASGTFKDVPDPTLPRAGSGSIESFVHDPSVEPATPLRLYRLKVTPLP